MQKVHLLGQAYCCMSSTLHTIVTLATCTEHQAETTFLDFNIYKYPLVGFNVHLAVHHSQAFLTL